MYSNNIILIIYKYFSIMLWNTARLKNVKKKRNLILFNHIDNDQNCTRMMKWIAGHKILMKSVISNSYYSDLDDEKVLTVFNTFTFSWYGVIIALKKYWVFDKGLNLRKKVVLNSYNVYYTKLISILAKVF